jgi:hypothetical protein
MKTIEEIEQLAESEYGTEIGSIRGSNPYDLERDRKNGYIKGYTQCQADMAIEIAELKIICQEYSKDVKALNDMLNSLNKQD